MVVPTVYAPVVLWPALATILLAVANSVTTVTASETTVVEYEAPPLHLAAVVVSIQVTQVAPDAYFVNSSKAFAAVLSAAAADAGTGTITTAVSMVDPYALTEVW